MDNSCVMCGLDGAGNLEDYVGDFSTRQGTVSLGVAIEDITRSPLDCQKMQPFTGLPDLDRSYDIGMCNPRSVARFANETGNRSSILSELFLQDLESDDTMMGMISAVDGGCTPLSDHALQRIARDRRSDE
jgi:hypothetical protein